MRNRYFNALAYIDAQLGRLFAFLSGRGLLERTVLVLSGDNGEAFYEHGFAGHAGPLYDEAVRVPLIVRAPGLAAGDDDRLAAHVDVPPTLLSVLGLPAHPGFQGVDILNAPADPRRSTYLVVQTAITEQLGLVRGGYKLIADFDFDRYYLYDLERDPGERRDLSELEPERVARMAGRLHAFQRAQLGYYANPAAQARHYAPLTSDEDPGGPAEPR